MERLDKALNYSFLLLKYRPRTEREIRDKLRLKKYSLATTRKAIEFLKDHGYIDDDVFAASFVRTRLLCGYGQLRIRFDLRRLGLDKERIDRQIASIKRKSYIEGAR